MVPERRSRPALIAHIAAQVIRNMPREQDARRLIAPPVYSAARTRRAGTRDFLATNRLETRANRGFPAYPAVQFTTPLQAVASTTTPNAMRYQAKIVKSCVAI